MVMVSTIENGIPEMSSRTREELIQHVTASSRTVTIVVGPTGCGKSTLVPPLLQKALGGRLLCTQPRRLAVVSVATRVAQQLSNNDKNLVGYHVGQHSTTTSQTVVIFATAGILLEELRAGGVQVLERYECIVLDECHERSVESDVCIAVLRQLLHSHPLCRARIVLMSATFDQERYKEYFMTNSTRSSSLGRIPVITLETAESFASYYDRVTIHYLEDTIKMVKQHQQAGDIINSNNHDNLRQTMLQDPMMDLTGNEGGKSLTMGLVRLIADAIRACHTKEPIEAPFLVFAPTYRHLEQVYSDLIMTMTEQSNDDGVFHVSVLHSSVDIEECMRSMKKDKHSTRRRRVLLSSAIAESSVTIPGVTVVIDTCRSLQVKYDGARKSTSSTTVFSSRSICDQRKGRTGRTCAGTVYRLVPARFYWEDLPAYETPHLTLSDCRDESMALLASAAKEMRNCQHMLLEACMDPPPATVANGAVKYLQEIGACFATPGQRSRLVPTPYGTLLAQLPFSIADSRAIVAAAQLGYLHEMLLYGSIKTIRPSPIVNYFADEEKSRSALERYHPDVDPKEPFTVSLAHMAAFMYWYTTWYWARREAALLVFRSLTTQEALEEEPASPKAVISMDQDLVRDLVEACESSSRDNHRQDMNVWMWTPAVDEVHTKWCREHEINPTSVRAIVETMEVTHKIFFVAKFEPEWLRSCPVDPIWNRPDDWKLMEQYNKADLLRVIYGENYCGTIRRAVEATDLGARLATIEPPTTDVCVHFLQGNCTFGDRCRKTHSLTAPLPICKYFLTGTCTRGKKCVFSHGQPANGKKKKEEKRKKIVDSMKSGVRLLESMSLQGGPKMWFRAFGDSTLLLGENNFSFSIALVGLGVKPAIMTDDKEIDVTSRRYFRLDASRIHGGINATRIHTYQSLREGIARRQVNCFAWNFPFTGEEEDEAGNEDLILATFLSLGLLAEKMQLTDTTFSLTLQGDQLVRWSVLKSAHRSRWFLKSWSAFDHSAFPGYRPARANGDPFPYECGRFYVFQHQPI